MDIHFAPLQGYTEDVYRRLHHRIFGGVAHYYTPFVRLENGKPRSKDLRDVKAEHNTGIPVIPQIIAADGKEAETLVQVLMEQNYRQIDLNMGCPFPLQTRHGRGAGVLVHPEKVEEIAAVVAKYSAMDLADAEGRSGISFSVKMRLGLEDCNEWRRVLPVLNEIPLSHITLHPRIASQQYKGSVDRYCFEEFLALCKHPVIYNGDIRSIEDIKFLEQKYPELAGIMIGRGLLARPSLAIEYKEGKAWSDRDVMRKVMELHAGLQEYYARIIPGEAQQLQKLKTFWDYFKPSEEDSSSLLDRKLWKKITKAGNMKNYLSNLPW